MRPVYIRRIMLFVAGGALLVPHWVPVLLSPGEGPLEYLAGLTLIVVVLWGWAVKLNRQDRKAVGQVP